MNTTKILCKYLDDENKGYVTGGDITCAVILVGFVTYLMIYFFACIGLAILNGIDVPIPTRTELYTITNIGLGALASSVGCIVLYTTYLLLKAFAKYKFVTCKRDD